MPTLIVENVPADVFDRLEKRAAADRRTLPDELLHLLKEALEVDKAPAPRLPVYIPAEEIPAPVDWPRSSQPVKVSVVPGKKRLPDAMVDED